MMGVRLFDALLRSGDSGDTATTPCPCGFAGGDRLATNGDSQEGRGELTKHLSPLVAKGGDTRDRASMRVVAAVAVVASPILSPSERKAHRWRLIEGGHVTDLTVVPPASRVELQRRHPGAVVEVLPDHARPRPSGEPRKGSHAASLRRRIESLRSGFYGDDDAALLRAWIDDPDTDLADIDAIVSEAEAQS